MRSKRRITWVDPPRRNGSGIVATIHLCGVPFGTKTVSEIERTEEATHPRVFWHVEVCEAGTEMSQEKMSRVRDAVWAQSHCKSLVSYGARIPVDHFSSNGGARGGTNGRHRRSPNTERKVGQCTECRGGMGGGVNVRRPSLEQMIVVSGMPVLVRCHGGAEQMMC